LDKHVKEKRDRLIALIFVSILLVLIYGPLATMFVAADRILYDQIAALSRLRPPADTVIVSINPAKMDQDKVLLTYGRIIQAAKSNGAKRIILAEPPPMEADAQLPGWAATLSAGIPVYVPSEHRFADVASKTGLLQLHPDADGVLRSLNLWQLKGGTIVPSLPLVIALSDPAFSSDPRISATDDVIFLARSVPIERLLPADIFATRDGALQLTGKTVFVDASPALSGAVATLPSGQFVTHSEIVATLLGNLEQHQVIIAPTWIKALEWLTPVLMAILAVLYLPERKRRDIVLVAVVSVVGLIMLEALLLFIFKLHINLGRPIVILIGTSSLAWWLTGTVRKAAVNAYKKGADFLLAGRLEPAFAEFRRCEATETVATAMYKLSLAFEEQAKPERAEAVLDWMKKTQGTRSGGSTKLNMLGKKGTPQRLGRYVIERKLGRGAMGAVYLARDPRINRPVALKVIPIEKEFEDEELEEARLRFFREAESAGRLTHPNIITVFDAGEDKHLAYIAMEFLPGVPLTVYTDPKKLLAPGKALELCARTADALDYAHNQGVIHRDIKPANLLYNAKQDLLKISDFGVARMTDNNRTKTGIVLGTPMYMSPEQLNAEELTGHSDLFSLSVTLYELLTGEAPFRATNIAVLMTKITTEDPTPVSNRRAGIPPSVDSVLFKALAKRPENRFSNGGEMAIALRNCAKYASR
jgi:serine/threonine-protein kinase